MQANLIKHHTLQIDGKITGIVLSEKEFLRILKIVKSVSITKSSFKKENPILSSTKLTELRNKNKNGNFISLKDMKKRLGL